MLRARRVLLALLFLGLLAAGAWVFFSYQINKPVGEGEKREIVVEPGESVTQVASRLHEAGLIRSASAFVLYVQWKGLTSKIQAGRYEIPPTLSIVQIAELLGHGTFDITVTFLEGWRKEQYLEYVLSKLPVDDETFSEEFLTLTEDLEGYLFPDTYLVSIDISADELVEILRSNFEERYQDNVLQPAASSGLTQEQIVILASLLERETLERETEEEMQTIAGILVKRWRSPGWPTHLLQVDATVQYALGYQEDNGEWWKDTLTSADLAVDSPYNTYKIKGLPPGPIANPGVKALKAAAGYKESPYWYYLHGKDGKVYYATTLKEHSRNRELYLSED